MVEAGVHTGGEMVEARVHTVGEMVEAGRIEVDMTHQESNGGIASVSRIKFPSLSLIRVLPQ